MCAILKLTIMKLRLLPIVFFLALTTNLFGQEFKNEDKKQIEEVLQSFKKGYQDRDTSKVTTWFNTLFYDNVEIIGTFSIEPQTREWEIGRKESIKLFVSDWVGWGDVEIDLKKANIAFDGDIAWVSFPAIISRNPNNSRSRTSTESYSNMLRNFESIIAAENEDTDEKMKLLQIAYYSNLLMYQYEQGDEFIWPLRISAVLQKKNDSWKFRQIHFSYPNRGFPNVRY